MSSCHIFGAPPDILRGHSNAFGTRKERCTGPAFLHFKEGSVSPSVFHAAGKPRTAL